MNNEIKDVRVVISHPNQKEISLTGQVSVQCEEETKIIKNNRYEGNK